MSTRSFIEVSLDLAGFHYWPTAPDHRDYLGHSHRHLFGFKVLVEVFDDDRELEFHDLKRQVHEWLIFDLAQETIELHVYNFGARSCEMIGQDLLPHLKHEFGTDRMMRIEVSEDGECSGIVEYRPSHRFRVASEEG